MIPVDITMGLSYSKDKGKKGEDGEWERRPKCFEFKAKEVPSDVNELAKLLETSYEELSKKA